ncbi:MAG: GGDEF domain-containing protein [Clostridia bacterium]|nr:GGDEF domain-containing protein [Clostridia bacterium]
MRRKKIAVLMASIEREYQQNFASGLAEASAGYGIDICIFNSMGHMDVSLSNSEKEECMIYDLPDLRQFDGIISMPATMGSDATLQKVFEVIDPLKGKPHISIDVRQENAVTIQFNDKNSVEELTEHMISRHGARRIMYVSGPMNSAVAMDRMEACRNAMLRNGLEMDETLLFDGQWTRTGGRQAAEKLLDRNEDLPDVIMCGNDDMALGVIEYLNEHGIRVPRDVAVTGFDASREAVMRGVTTIRRPIDRTAQKAIEILNRWIDGEKPAENVVHMNTIPVYGDSCGCMKNQEHLNEMLRNLGAEKWNMETTLTCISMYSGSMAGVGNEAEAYQRIQEFIRYWDIRDFFLCADPSVCRETGGEENVSESYPPEMLLLYGMSDGKTYEPVLFATRDLIPVFEDKREATLCLIFCPLYYRTRSFGYVALNPGSLTNGAALYPFLMLLNGALMSLYLQTNIKRYTGTIEQMAIRDIMTGMLNRRGFLEKAPAVMEKARKENRVFAILSADMNHMKHINDEFGHLSGDVAICRMGKAMESLTAYSFVPVHISGDEFLAYGILDNTEDADKVVSCAKEAIDSLNARDPWICDISASFGIYAAVPQENDTIDQYMTLADRRMYEDKNSRKYGRRKEDLVINIEKKAETV